MNNDEMRVTAVELALKAFPYEDSGLTVLEVADKILAFLEGEVVATTFMKGDRVLGVGSSSGTTYRGTFVQHLGEGYNKDLSIISDDGGEVAVLRETLRRI